MQEFLAEFARHSTSQTLDLLFETSLNESLEKDGWGARIRTQEWRDQNPLPYRLATPQRKELAVKNTITLLICLFLSGIFLFFLAPANAAENESCNTEFQSKLIIQQSTNQPIKALRRYRDGLLNENQGQLFFNLDQVNILNSNNGELAINYILVDDKDFYLATNLGIFQNYRQIFSKENCNHIEKTSKEIFIACQSGIYQSSFDKKNKFSNFDWQILSSSPQQVRFFTLNKSGSNLNYAVSPLGFYVYNPHKKSWQLSNYGLGRNFQESFGLGRYLLTSDVNKSEQILLPSALGMMLSKDQGKTWLKESTGIEGGPDGFFVISEVKEFKDKFIAITNTGIYFRNKDSDYQWKKLEMLSSKKDSFANQNFTAMDLDKDNVFLANSQGEIFQLSEKEALTAVINKDQGANISNEDIFALLELEPKIQSVHQAAMQFSGIPTGEGFKRYRKQARIRNLLPELQTFVEKDNLDFISFETQGSDGFSTSSGNYTSSFDKNKIDRNNYGINTGLRLNWKLGNMIYDPEINDINTSARISANVTENILTEVTQIYFRRKELLVKVFSELEPSIASKLELDQLLAQLDARTGAWYSEELKRNLIKTKIESELKEFYYDS